MANSIWPRLATYSGRALAACTRLPTWAANRYDGWKPSRPSHPPRTYSGSWLNGNKKPKSWRDTSEDWSGISRLSEEPRRFGGDAGARARRWPRVHPGPIRGRRARGQHLRVHRLGQTGIDRGHPRDGPAQTRRILPATDRDWLSGGAGSGRAHA